MSFESLRMHNAMSLRAKVSGSPPAVRVRVDDEIYVGFCVHKWSVTESPKGDFLAIAIVGLDDHDLSQVNIEKCQNLISSLPDIDSIENGTHSENICVFKAHCSQWRPVTFKKTKWSYLDKIDKTKPCNVERILV